MMVLLQTFPQQDGYWMPAEFEPHSGCWMLWPTRPDVWRLKAAPAQEAFVQIASAIAQFEPVTVGAGAAFVAQARRRLPNSVRVVELAYDDIWARDSAPTFVVNDQGGVRGVDWQFNAWGGLYADFRRDDALAAAILQQAGADRYRADFVLEGGAIHVDGEGTLITTRECLLNPNRNPSLTETEIEMRLQCYLNVQKVIWLDGGVFNDETSGHVDNLCFYARPSEVVLTWTDDKDDPQYERSLAAYETLRSATDAKGRPLTVHRIQQPGLLLMSEQEGAGVKSETGSKPRQAGDRLAASYMNCYLPNGGVVVPVFNDPHDAAALATLQAIYPERRVVGVYAREILLGGGNIHCIVQQQPKG